MLFWLEEGELDEQQDLKADLDCEELEDEIDTDREEEDEQLLLLLVLLEHPLLDEEWHGALDSLLHDELDENDTFEELLLDETSECELHDNELLLQLLEWELSHCDDEDEELEMLF